MLREPAGDVGDRGELLGGQPQPRQRDALPLHRRAQAALDELRRFEQE